MRVLITGAAGFLGSHLCDRFIAEGHEVIGLDSFITGSPDNIVHLLGHPRFTFVRYDVTNFLHVPGKVDLVMHFASPASPKDYLNNPIHTMKVNSVGTLNTLGLAKGKGARYVLASTSEVYGDPEEHPQSEDYWGHVNPVGPRGVYDEAKRFAEALVMAYQRIHSLDVRIARIYNTYGPRMRPDDGRVVSTFIAQALRGEPLTVYGDGSQTRSFCYVDDMVDGIFRLATSPPDVLGPSKVINLGNPEEVTVLELAERVRRLVGREIPIVFHPLPEDDPKRRCPDINRARRLLGWEPSIHLEEGLARTYRWIEEQLRKAGVS
ncbi:MAG: UDP-glucuronic acid decarboxylase family protein [Nitrososphaerota archaeon]